MFKSRISLKNRKNPPNSQAGKKLSNEKIAEPNICSEFIKLKPENVFGSGPIIVYNIILIKTVLFGPPYCLN